MFFALHGASFDGNDYAVQSLEKGASVAVIDRADVLEANPDYAEDLILVEDQSSFSPATRQPGSTPSSLTSLTSSLRPVSTAPLPTRVTWSLRFSTWS